MKATLNYARTPSSPTRDRRSLRASAAFTLVELLTVIAIIVLLVGITISILGFAQKKAALSKAEGQLDLLITGLGRYEKEYGEYPEPIDNSGKGDGGAKALYQALSGDGTNFLVMASSSEGGGASTGEPGTSGEVFIEGLDPRANKHGLVGGSSGNYQLVDPFAQPWFYRKYVKDDPGEKTNKRTYDLWSVGTDRKQTNQAKWIKNW